MKDLEKMIQDLEEEQTTEMLVQLSKENQTRKILSMLMECKDLEEAISKIKGLLNE